MVINLLRELVEKVGHMQEQMGKADWGVQTPRSNQKEMLEVKKKIVTKMKTASSASSSPAQPERESSPRQETAAAQNEVQREQRAEEKLRGDTTDVSTCDWNTGEGRKTRAEKYLRWQWESTSQVNETLRHSQKSQRTPSTQLPGTWCYRKSKKLYWMKPEGWTLSRAE